jgi:hypothetical protein
MSCPVWRLFAADAHAVHRTAQAGPPPDGKASPGQRGILALQVCGTCSGICFASGEVGGALQPWQRSHQGAAKKQEEIHPSGPLGQLKSLEEALLKHIFKQRKQGIKISTLLIVLLALDLSTAFGKKDFAARCSAVKHFLRAHLLVY